MPDPEHLAQLHRVIRFRCRLIAPCDQLAEEVRALAGPGDLRNP